MNGTELSSFLRRLLVSPTTNGKVQLIRYGFVATVAFIVDFGLLYIFTSQLHLFYLLSTFLAFGISLIVNYLLSTMWVFAKRDTRRRSVEITLFVIICFVALYLNLLFMWLFTSVFSIYYLYSKLATVTLVFIWSFGARRFIFHPRKMKSLSEKLRR